MAHSHGFSDSRTNADSMSVVKLFQQFKKDSNYSLVKNESAEKHGLFLRTSADDGELITYLNSEPVVVLKLPGRSQSDAQADLSNLLETACAEKIAELEATYGVSISRNGVIEYAGKHGPVPEPARTIEVRQPNFGEVLSLEFALKRTLPHAKQGKTSLQFLFLIQPSTNGALAEWELSSNNKPTVLIQPACSERPLEYVLMHELSHHSQYKMGLNPLAPFEWKVCNSLGWQTFDNHLTGERNWAMVTKSGSLYKYSNHLRRWISCNKSGQPVDSIGTRVAHQSEADYMTSKELAQIALVRPATTYMNNPLEVMAEGLAMLRMGQQQRRVLLEKSPELYDLVKDFDQRLIDKQFGTGMVRTLDGLVAERSSDKVISIANFEQQKRASERTEQTTQQMANAS